jgi:hypothetical protein
MILRLMADNTPISAVMAEQHGWVYGLCKEWSKAEGKTFYIPPLGDEERMVALENWQVMDNDRQAEKWEDNVVEMMAAGKVAKLAPLRSMSRKEYDEVMLDRPEKAGIMLSTGKFWQLGMNKREALKTKEPIFTMKELVRQLALKFIPEQLQTCQGTPRPYVVTQRAHDDGEEKEDKDDTIKLDDSVPPAEVKHDDTGNAIDESMTTASASREDHRLPGPSGSSTPVKASTKAEVRAVSVAASSIQSSNERRDSVKSRTGKRLSERVPSTSVDRSKKARSVTSSTVEDPDDSIVDPLCPEVYIGKVSKTHHKSEKTTSTCLVKQCLAKGPEYYHDDVDNPALPYYDTMTVEEAFISSSLAAGTRFDMTKFAKTRINILYREWGTLTSTIPEYCSASWAQCDRWLEQLDYWPATTRVGLVMFDCEHWSEASVDKMVKERGLKKSTVKNYISAFTMCAINGVMLTIRVNYDGNGCQGKLIPPKVKAILQDPLIRKQMFGIGHDINALKCLDINVRNWADTGRLMIGADPQPDAIDPKSGKAFAAEWHRCPVAFHYAGRNNNSTLIPRGGYKFENKFKDWTADMNLYNFFDNYVAWATVLKIAAETALTRGRSDQADIIRYLHLWHDIHRGRGCQSDHTHRPTHEWLGTRPTYQDPYPSIPALSGNYAVMGNTLASTVRNRKLNTHRYRFDYHAVAETTMTEYEAIHGEAHTWIDGSKSDKFLRGGKAFPHVFKVCRDYDHPENECKAKDTFCLYSVCRSANHNIDFCPVINSRCTWCEDIGHMKDDHGNHLTVELRNQFEVGRPLSAMAFRTIDGSKECTVVDAGNEGFELKME